MKNHCQYILKTQSACLTAALASWATASQAVAQIIPDATLPNSSTIAPKGSTLTIDGGTTAGSNLFHNFSEFSVPTGIEAFSNNSTAIVEFYRQLTNPKINQAEALRRAQVTLLNSRYDRPYFWAPFVLVGNWQ